MSCQHSKTIVPKLFLGSNISFSHHRSGWAFAVKSLSPLLKADGIFLDAYVEGSFCWRLAEYRSLRSLPYKGDWVGFIHNPPGIPPWHSYRSSPQFMFELPEWHESLQFCRGLFVFSKTLRDWLKDRIAVPISAVIHPTESSLSHFDIERFALSKEPRLVQVGAWLRRMNSIALLNVERIRKSCLIPLGMTRVEFFNSLRLEQTNEHGMRGADWSSVELIEYLPPTAYDDLLSRNVVFLDLYDTSVNNTIIECITRGTPIVCNRLPALAELLGAEYPLFFETLEEASQIADDLPLLIKGAEYLKSLSKHVFSPEYFAASIAESDVYRCLPG